MPVVTPAIAMEAMNQPATPISATLASTVAQATKTASPIQPRHGRASASRRRSDGHVAHGASPASRRRRAKRPSSAASAARGPCSTMRPSSRNSDTVGEAHGGEAMGDDQRRAPRREPTDRVGHGGFRATIQSGRALVEQQHAGLLLEEGPRQRQPLHLATRQCLAMFAERRVVASRQGRDEPVGGRQPGGGPYAVETGIRIAQPDVVEHAALEHVRSLRHDRDMAEPVRGIERWRGHGR